MHERKAASYTHCPISINFHVFPCNVQARHQSLQIHSDTVDIQPELKQTASLRQLCMANGATICDWRQVWETRCGPRHPEWETSVEDKCGRQVGDKCKLMRPKAPRVEDKCGRQVWETSVNSCGPRHPEWETSAGDKWETIVNSCRPRHPE